MTDYVRASEVDGGPFLESDLILHNHFEAAVKTFPDEVAVVSCHQRPDLLGYSSGKSDVSKDCLRWTYRELWERSEHLAKALLVRGIPTDRRMVVFLRNQAEWPLLFCTSLRLGIGFVPMGPILTDSPVELKHQLAIAEPGIIFAADEKTALALERIVPELIGNTRLKIVASDSKNKRSWTSLQQLLKTEVGSNELPHVQRSPDDVTTFYFSSGITSLPKAAPCKSSNIVRAMFGYANSWCIDTTRRLVAQSPSFHSYTGNGWFSFWLRGACIVYPSAIYNAAAILEAIEKEGCTDMMGNPSIIASLVDHSTAESRDLSSLVHIKLSGSVVKIHDIQRCIGPPFNARIVDASYGSTETATLSNWPLHDQQPAYAEAVSVGKVIPGVKARICYQDSRKPVPFGVPGELHVGGEFFYHGWPGRDETNFYTEDDIVWVKTGDQARFGDHDELYILGRYKDLIIRGGRNISPTAIEAVVNILPGTSSVAVGLPDEVAGEVPAIIVRYDDGIIRTDGQIKETVMKTLGKYATPQRVIRLEDLGLSQFPLTAARKTDKRRLTALVKEYIASSQPTQPSGMYVVDSTESTVCKGLIGILADLTLQKPTDIDIDLSVTAFADSLLLLQATSLIKKRLKRSVNVEQILVHPTIRQLTQLLASQLEHRKVPAEPRLERSGSPSSGDIAHARHNGDAFTKIKTVIKRKLSTYNLDWNDIEDVMPCYDNSRFMLSSAQRLQSWNDRHVLVADGDVRLVHAALSRSLEHHPLSRSIAVQYERHAWLHVVIRATQNSIQHIIDTAPGPVSEEDLPQYRLNDPDLDHASRDGFAFKATVVPIASGSCSGVVINMNHSTYDAISTSLWLDDFALCLAGRANEMPARVPYKNFADAYYFGRHCSAAQRSVRFFMRSLLWYVTEQKAWWPKQRQRGWFMGDAGGWHTEEEGDIESTPRHPIDLLAERCGSIGFISHIKVTDDLYHRHGISAVALFKAAVAIFNVHQTNVGFAIISSWEAARIFPFLEENPVYAAMLPDPMDIAGPTGQRVVNRISVKRDQTTLKLLSDIQEELAQISKHAHPPLYEIRDKLAEISTTEADAFMDALQRQIFNWVPNIRAGSVVDSQNDESSGASASKPVLRRMHRIARGDCGFAWTGCRTSKDTVAFSVWWDDAQLSWREAKSALSEVVACVDWMMAPDNWNKHVSQWWEASESLSKAAEANVALADVT